MRPRSPICPSSSTCRCKTQTKYAPFAWVFEVDANDAGTVRSQVKIARTLWSYSESGLYRAVPYSSVAGEGLARLWEAFSAPVDEVRRLVFSWIIQK